MPSNEKTNRLDNFYNDIISQINNNTFMPNKIIQETDEGHFTPIEYALYACKEDCFNHKLLHFEDKNKCTIFGERSLKKLYETFYLLITHKSEINLTNKDGSTALMKSISSNSYIQEGYLKVLELLLVTNNSIENHVSRKLKIKNMISSWGPLIEGGYMDFAKLLIEHGADINIKDKEGNTVIMYALDNCDWEALSFLIGIGVNTDLTKEKGEEALLLAIRNLNLDIIKFLIENGTNVSQEALNIAIEKNNIEVLKIIFSIEVDVNKIHFPINIYNFQNWEIDIDILKFLIKNGLVCNTHIFGQIGNTTDIARILIENTKNKKLLHEYYALSQSKNNFELLNLLEEYEITFGTNSFNVKLINFVNNLWKLMMQNIFWSITKYRVKYNKFKEKYLKKNIPNISRQYSISIQNLNYVSFNFHLPEIIQSINDVHFIESLLDTENIHLDINAINQKGRTALMIACQLQNVDLVKLLVRHKVNIDIKDNQKKTALQYSLGNQEISTFLIKEKYIKTNHHPKALVTLLTNFRKDTPIKYTTHEWDMSFKEEYGNFQGYLEKVKKDWDKIETELKNLSPRLHTKIHTFLLNRANNVSSWCSKEGNGINIGWSSLEGLEKWCNDGNNPFMFALEKPYKIENNTLSTFGEVITLFKQEIQIRKENNVLEKIFKDIDKNIYYEYKEKSKTNPFKIEVTKLKGKAFYTDTAVFKDVLNRIFKDIKQRPEYPNIKIEIVEDDKYYDLRIIQVGSEAGVSSSDMLKLSTGGDSSIIRESLKNLCDWSVESSYEDEFYRVNYLKSDNRNDIEILDVQPIGFTHILRFFKSE